MGGNHHLSGDINGDGIVDQEDIDLVLLHLTADTEDEWGTAPPQYVSPGSGEAGGSGGGGMHMRACVK